MDRKMTPKPAAGAAVHGRMRILISNDDGIYSPGLAALARVAMRFGEVRIVAPDVEQSSASQAITATRPLSYRRTKPPNVDCEAYRVNGTPADCVALGIFIWEKVDLVLSGINLGPNLGNACWHSGTLAAAKQGALLGARGIAFSTPVHEAEPNFETICPWVEKTLTLLHAQKQFALVNVNLPSDPRGITWTRQSFRHYDGRIVPGKDPMGRQHYWYTVVPIEQVEPGTDRWAVGQGLVSLTPLLLDLTDHQQLADAQQRQPLEQLEPAAQK
jgi:5'-nucleotidase